MKDEKVPATPWNQCTACVSDERMAWQPSWHGVSVRIQNYGHGDFIQMTVQNGFQHFHCDMQPNQRGLQKCQQIAEAMGLQLWIADDASRLMQSVE